MESESWTTVSRKGSKKKRKSRGAPPAGVAPVARSATDDPPPPPQLMTLGGVSGDMASAADEAAVDALLRTVEAAVEAIDKMDCVASVHGVMDEMRGTVELVCYGVGSFADAPIPRAQLALAEAIRRRLVRESGDHSRHDRDIPQGGSDDAGRSGGGGSRSGGGGGGGGGGRGEPSFRAIYFDPVTNALEARALARLGWTLVQDEEGKHQTLPVQTSAQASTARGGDDGDRGGDIGAGGADGGGGGDGGGMASDEAGAETGAVVAAPSNRSSAVVTTTLFYMPHCPFRLYR